MYTSGWASVVYGYGWMSNFISMASLINTDIFINCTRNYS